MKKIILMFLATALFSSCLTTNLSERKNDEQILLGKIQLILQDAENTAGVKLSGRYHDNVRISLKNVQTGKSYTQFSDTNGYFTVSDPLSGDYTIELFTIAEKGDGSSAINTYPVLIPFTLEDVSDVNCLGELIITITKNDEAVIQQINDDESSKLRFEKQFPNSDWLETEWSFVPVVEY